MAAVRTLSHRRATRTFFRVRTTTPYFHDLFIYFPFISYSHDSSSLLSGCQLNGGEVKGSVSTLFLLMMRGNLTGEGKGRQ